MLIISTVCVFDFRSQHGGFNFKSDFQKIPSGKIRMFDWNTSLEENNLKGHLVTVFCTINLWVNNGITPANSKLSSYNPKAPPPAVNVSFNLLDVGVLL